MANRNYRNYRTYSESETKAKDVENSIVNNADTEEVTEIENVIANDTGTEEATEIENAIVNDADTEEAKDTDMPTQIEGTVKDCTRLNVREAPSIDSSVRCVIPEGTKLHVDVLGSTKEWLKVCLDDGTHGFVMAKYVEYDHLFDVG